MPAPAHPPVMTKAGNGDTSSAEGLSASVQILPLPPGLYLFSVNAAMPARSAAAGQLTLPAVHVGLGPGVRAEQVEFIEGPGNQGPWLFSRGDLLISKIQGSGASLILTSVRAPRGETLSIKVERLDARTQEPTAVIAAAPEPATAAKARAAPEPATAAKARAAPKQTAAATRTPHTAPTTSSDGTVPLQIGAHIRSRGDMRFVDAPWAGRVAPGLWIESFSVRPVELKGGLDIEYKGLTGSGFETPWIGDDEMCGTKGMAVPLVGFAVRIKSGAAAVAYDCEYSGFFQSGQTVGPLRNGAPCRSSVANDPLEGIQLKVVRRAADSQSASAARVPRARVRPVRARGKAARRPRTPTHPPSRRT